MPLLSPLLSVGVLKHASVCCAPPPPAAAAPSGLTSAGHVTFTQRSSSILQQQQHNSATGHFVETISLGGPVDRHTNTTVVEDRVCCKAMSSLLFRQVNNDAAPGPAQHGQMPFTCSNCILSAMISNQELLLHSAKLAVQAHLLAVSQLNRTTLGKPYTGSQCAASHAWVTGSLDGSTA